MNAIYKYGDSSKVLTVSNGKYQEVFSHDSIVRIGSVMVNIKKRKITQFILRDTIQSEATLEPEVVSRWLSPDPLASKYPYLTPYNFVANSPIIFVDPDGRKIKGVTVDKQTGELVFSKRAQRSGLENYITVRMKTDEGRQSVMKLIDDPRKFTIRVTDELLATQGSDGKYYVRYGITAGNETIITSNLTSPQEIINNGGPDDHITVYDPTTGTHKQILRKNFATTNENNDYEQARNDSKIEEFKTKNPNSSNTEIAKEQELHGRGANEETHLLQNDKEREDTYNSEKSSNENELKARSQYKTQVLKEQVKE